MDLLELWIFIFSTPGTLDPEAGTDRTRMSKYGFPKVWPHHYTRFFTEISKNNIRNAYLQANDGLWANYTFYKNQKFPTFCFDFNIDFLIWTSNSVLKIKKRNLKSSISFSKYKWIKDCTCVIKFREFNQKPRWGIRAACN